MMILKSAQIQEIDITGFHFDDETETDGEIFVIVEDMPLFIGKNHTSFRDWINQNLSYPRLAIEHGIEGTVIVSFVINREGKISNVEILRGVDPLLDNEAAKVIASSPDWTPGRQRGRPQNVRFTFPVRFTIGAS